MENSSIILSRSGAYSFLEHLQPSRYSATALETCDDEEELMRAFSSGLPCCGGLFTWWLRVLFLFLSGKPFKRYFDHDGSNDRV